MGRLEFRVRECGNECGLLTFVEVRFANWLTPYPCPFPLPHDHRKGERDPAECMSFGCLNAGVLSGEISGGIGRENIDIVFKFYEVAD